jgi:hypothetical protein
MTNRRHKLAWRVAGGPLTGVLLTLMAPEQADSQTATTTYDNGVIVNAVATSMSTASEATASTTVPTSQPLLDDAPALGGGDEVSFEVPNPGVYYITVESRTLRARFNEMPQLTLRATVSAADGKKS